MVKKYAPKVIKSLDDTYHFTDPIKNGVSTLIKNIKESRKESRSNGIDKLFKSRPVHELMTSIAISKMNRDNEKREKKSRLQNEYDTAKKEYDEVQKQYDDAVRRKDFDALETLEKKLNRASDRWIKVRNDYNG
jgi:Tfp pilus assembly major pilin PilA